MRPQLHSSGRFSSLLSFFASGFRIVDIFDARQMLSKQAYQMRSLRPADPRGWKIARFRARDTRILRHKHSMEAKQVRQYTSIVSARRFQFEENGY
jgi:hypothetical protein